MRAAVNATDFTATGDAQAINEGLVIICQRRNADDIECLAPPEPEVPIDDPVDDPVDPVENPTTTTVAVSPESGTTPTTTPGMIPPASGEAPRGPQGFSNPTPQRSGTLPSTGSDVADWMLYAGCILLLGFGLMVVAHRRRQMPVPVLVATHRDDLWSLVPPED